MANKATDTSLERQSEIAAEEVTTRRQEAYIALVLAIAGIASAWANFQGGSWDKREAEGFAISNSYLTESSQMQIRAGQEQQVTAALFLQWIEAKADSQTLRAEVIANHMPPWFADEFLRWRSELPKDFNKFKPNSPLPSFKSPSTTIAKQLHDKSVARRKQAVEFGRIGDRYDNANVILATALFLAGISSVLHRPSGRRVVVILAGLLTAMAIVSMVLTARLPMP